MVLTKFLYCRKIFFNASMLVALFCLSAFLSGCGTTRESALDKQYQRIVEQQQAKHDAFDETDIASKLPPADDPRTFERMGDAYFWTGNIAMAFIEYSKALRLDPRNQAIEYKIAQCMLKQKLWGQALEQFDRILDRSPGETGAMQGRATALMHLCRFEAAEAALRSVIENNSAMWQAYALLGMVHDRQKHFLFAAEAYEKAIAINPKAPGIHERLGRSLYKAEQYRDSAAALLKAIQLAPSRKKVYNYLGFALFKTGLESEAFDAFKKAGDEASACKNMGMLYLEKEEYARSIDYFSKAIDINPTYYEAAQRGLKQASAALGN